MKQTNKAKSNTFMTNTTTHDNKQEETTHSQTLYKVIAAKIKMSARVCTVFILHEKTISA
jgi:hypothetical protein